jgi:hypothetical protein
MSLPATFLYDKMTARQYARLMVEIEENTITRVMLQMAFAKWKLDPAVVLREMLVEFSHNGCQTTVFHSMFAHCGTPVLDWLLVNVISENKKAVMAREPHTQSTVLHIVAQRPPPPASEKAYWAFHSRLFLQAGIDCLRLTDSAGGTAMDYIAVIPQTSHTYDKIMLVYPALSRKIGAATLRAEKLSSDLEHSNKTNRVLANQLEAARDSMARAEEEALRLQKLVTTEHIKIDSLLKQSGQARERALELTRQEIMYAGLSDESALRIAELTRERDDAKRDSQMARDELLSVGKNLQAARDEQTKLALLLEEARAQSDANDQVLKQSAQERRELTDRISALREEIVTGHGERAEELRTRISALQGELDTVDRRYEEAETDRQRAMHVLKTLESDLSTSVKDLEGVQARYNAAKSKNEELNEALRVADTKQRDMQAELERVRMEVQTITEEKLEAEKSAHQLQQRTSAEQQMLQSELLTAKTMLEDAEERAIYEQTMARDALARIEDAELRAEQAARLAVENERSQKELEVLRASHSSLLQIHNRAEELSREETARLNEALEQMRKELQKERVYSAAIEELRRDRDEKAEQLRIALQKHTESIAVGNEARAMLEQKQKETDSATPSPRIGTPRRPGGGAHTIRRSGTLRAGLATSPSGSTLKQKADAASVLDDPDYINGQLNSTFFSAVAHSCAAGEHEKLAMLFGVDVSPNTVDPVSLRCLLEVAIRASNDTARNLRANKAQMDVASLLALSERLVRTVMLLIESGAEWDAVDKFIESSECALSTSTLETIRSRDDMSPFIKALMSNDPIRAQSLLDRVQNLDRVPCLHNHEFEKLDYSFVHLAVLCASGRIMPSKKLFGRGDDVKNGKRNDTMLLLLVRAGAPCDITDANECSPLHLALLESKHMQRQMFLNVVEYLLAGGADPEEVCRYERFIEKASNHVKSGGGGLFSGRKSSSATVKQKSAARSEFETKYNTPIKWAQERNEADLLHLLSSRRYRRVTIEQLSEYIEEGVRFSCRILQMHVSGVTEAGDELDNLCKIYTGNFHWFNLRYESINNRCSVLVRLYYEINHAYSTTSDPPLVHPEEFYALLDQHLLFFEKLKQLVMQPDADVMKGTPADALSVAQRTYLRSLRLPKRPPAEANASPIWKVTETLIKCVEQIRKRMFEVSDLIRGPAMELFHEASLSVLAKLVREDMWREMLDMLERADALYGDLHVDSIIVADRKFQCIDIAVQHGSVRCLELLMQRQRMRLADLSVPGPCGSTLVSIAVKAGHAISLVVIDLFRWTNKMCAEKNPNALHYGVVVESSQTTVLHQCALLGRADLLHFCVDFVQYHIQSRTTNGSKFTPLQLAQTRLRNCSTSDESADAVADRLSASECVELLLSYEGDQPALAPEDKAPLPPQMEKPERLLPPPLLLDEIQEDPLLPPPPLLLPPPLLAEPAPASSSEEGDDSKKKHRKRKKKTEPV